MDSTYYVVAAVVLVVSAILCGFLAPLKNRPAAVWAFLGLVFGIFALLALAFLPKRDPAAPQPRSNPLTVAVLAILVIGAAAVMLALMNGWL